MDSFAASRHVKTVKQFYIQSTATCINVCAHTCFVFLSCQPCFIACVNSSAHTCLGILFCQRCCLACCHWDLHRRDVVMHEHGFDKCAKWEKGSNKFDGFLYSSMERYAFHTPVLLFESKTQKKEGTQCLFVVDVFIGCICWLFVCSSYRVVVFFSRNGCSIKSRMHNLDNSGDKSVLFVILCFTASAQSQFEWFSAEIQ